MMAVSWKDGISGGELRRNRRNAGVVILPLFAVKQIAQAADAEPPIPVGLQGNSVLALGVRYTVLLSEQVYQSFARAIGPEGHTMRLTRKIMDDQYGVAPPVIAER